VESAIPEHLRIARTRHRRVRDDYAPPYPSFVARHQPSVARVVMAYFGLQYKGDAPTAAGAALDRLADAFRAPQGPGHWDRARYVDEADYANVVSVAYWDEPARFDAWFAGVRDAWTGDGEAVAGLGTFTEVLRPSVEGYETLFSSLGRPEGIAALATGMSGEVQEHAYWGGMRDRIPLSQTNEMAPAGAPSLIRDGARLRVKPQDNLCLIRPARIGATPTPPSGKCISRRSSRCCAKGWIFCAMTVFQSAAMPTAT